MDEGDGSVEVIEVKREDGFKITVASELMAVICLTTDIIDLKKRIADIIVAYNRDGDPVKVKDLRFEGAIASLLKNAIDPNLVQTIEHTPAFIHGGPFANIAHGCNSIIATKLALKLGDIVVTEAGFGADLGAEKFFDIKCRTGNLKPNAAVLVVTIRALKLHGEGNLEQALPNLEKHIENIQKFGVPLVVAINKFTNDRTEEINKIIDFCKKKGVKFSLSEAHAKGGKGALDLANKILQLIENDGSKFQFLYPLNIPVKSKIEMIAKELYGADGVNYDDEAEENIALIKKLKLEHLPVCMAKTQMSLSDNPSLLGRPIGFKINVKRLSPCTGAGFIVAYCGDIMVMPGMPEHPAAELIDIDKDGKISGLF